MPIDKFPRKTSGQAARTGLGDLEYFAELANDPSSDPWSQLGTKVAGAGLLYNNPQGAQYISKYPQQSDYDEFQNQEGVGPVFNTVYTGMDRNVAPVQTHEFRHAGAEYIKDNYTPEDFIKRWGPEAGAVYNLITRGNTSEGSVEAFDNPLAQATGQSPAFGGTTMDPTIQFMQGPAGFIPPELTDVVKRRMGGIASDIMSDIGVPRRTVPKGGR